MSAEEKPHLSSAQLNMIGRCQVQYRYRYLDGIKSPPGVAATIGKGVHAAIGKDLGNKMEWGELLDDEAIPDFAADATRAAWQEDEPRLVDDDPGQDAAVDIAIELAKLHHLKAAPGIEPVALEKKFRLVLDGPYDLVGVPDVEEAGTIRDTKTAGKTPSADEADRSLQLTVYHLAAARAGAEKEVALDYLVKTQKPKLVQLRSTRGPEDHARLLRRVEIAAQTIASGVFAPTNADNWWCSDRWCGYWNICEFGSRGRKRTT